MGEKVRVCPLAATRCSKDETCEMWGEVGTRICEEWRVKRAEQIAKDDAKPWWWQLFFRPPPPMFAPYEPIYGCTLKHKS